MMMHMTTGKIPAGTAFAGGVARALATGSFYAQSALTLG